MRKRANHDESEGVSQFATFVVCGGQDNNKTSEYSRYLPNTPEWETNLAPKRDRAV